MRQGMTMTKQSPKRLPPYSPILLQHVPAERHTVVQIINSVYTSRRLTTRRTA